MSSNNDKLERIKTCLSEVMGGKDATIFQGKWVNRDAFFRYYWACCEALKIFCENVIPRCHIKKERLQLLLNAIKLREKIIKDKNHNEDFIAYFDYYRHEIHKFAKKGKKIIREYNYPIINKFDLERLSEWK